MDKKKLKELVDMMEELGLDELEVRSLFKKIRIVRARNRDFTHSTEGQQAQVPVHEKEKEAVTAEERAEIEGTFSIKSPLVGTFYRAPAPGTEPFVQEGDIVEPGQVVGIVEAMKVMNEIEADRRGKVVKILVNDAEPVEYGQDLMLLSPL